MIFRILVILIFLNGCSDNKTNALPDTFSEDTGVDTRVDNDTSIDLSDDATDEPDITSEKCEDTTQTCLTLGFYGGDLTCENGSISTQTCTQCPAHKTKSTGSLSGEWTRTGPPGGNITALLALENNVVLAGTGRTNGRAGSRPFGYGTAIYRSEDGGKTFSVQQKFSDFSGNKIHNFARVGTSNRIYVTVSASTTDANGVWMSDDAGVTWTDVSAGLHDSARPRWVAAAPGDPERVFLTVEGVPGDPRADVHSLYRRDDGGDWTRIEANGTENDLALSIAILDRENVVLLSKSKFYKTTNAGKDFVSFSLNLPNPTSSSYIPKLILDPKNADHIFRTTENVSLSESLDGGETWLDLGLGFGQTDIALVDDKVLITARTGGLQTWNQGRFTALGDCLLAPNPTAISIAPDDPSKIYLGFDGQGVLRSTDGGETFSPQESGIDDLLGKVVVTGPIDASVAWIVSAAGLFRSLDSGDSWDRVADNQGTLAFNTVAQDPTNSNRVLVGTHGDWYAGGGPSAGVFELDLEKKTIYPILAFQGEAPAINAIVFDPTDANIVYVYQDKGGKNDGGATLIFVSKDGGKTFQAADVLSQSFTGNSTCSGNLFSLSPTGTPYFCSRPLDDDQAISIYTSNDKGMTFDTFWTGAAKPDGSVRPYTGMYVDKDESVYLTGTGESGILVRHAGETDFAEFGSGLSAFAKQIWHMTWTPEGGLLLSTSDGVYFAANGADFVAMNEGFEALRRSPRGHSVAYIPGTRVVLYATARGVFRRILPE